MASALKLATIMAAVEMKEPSNDSSLGRKNADGLWGEWKGGMYWRSPIIAASAYGKTYTWHNIKTYCHGAYDVNAYFSWQANICMLLCLTLTNWRSHATSHIEFAKGANILLGPMGAGKSSVVDALCFALYGTYPKLQRRDAAIEDVCNFRHIGQQVSVELQWEGKEGRKYKVRRELVGKGAGKEDGAPGKGGKGSATGGGAGWKGGGANGKSDAWLYCDGKILQKGPKAVTLACEEALGIDYDLFSRAAYSEQNRLDFWLSLSPSSRKAELDRLLGLDAFERARANCTTEMGKKKERAQELEGRASPGALLEANKRALEAKDEFERWAREGKDAATLLLEARKKAQEAIEAHSKEEKKRLEDERLRKILASLGGKVDTLQKQQDALANLPAANEAGAKAADAEEKYLAAKKASAEASGKLQAAKQEEGKLLASYAAGVENAKKRAQLKELQEKKSGGKALEAWKVDEERLKGEVLASSKRNAALEEELKSVLAAIAALGEAGMGECPVCGSPLDEKHRGKLEAKKNAKVAALGAQMAGEKERAQKASKDYADASKACQELAAIEAKISATPLEDLPSIEKKLSDASAESSRLFAGAKAAVEIENKLLELRRDLRAQEEKIAQAAKVKIELEGAMLEKAKTSAQIESNGYDAKSYSEKSACKSEAEKNLAALEVKVQTAGKIAAQSAKLHEACAREASALAKQKEEAEAQRRHLDELGAFREALLATQSEVRSLLLGELNGALGRLWPILYPYSDWRGLRLLADEKDYSLQVWQGQWRALESFASGGERAAGALALRVALSVILTPQLGFIVLDEPTHNLDSKAVATLGHTLSDQLPKILPQVIVITHEAALLESTPGKVFRFERDKGNGEDTQVAVD